MTITIGIIGAGVMGADHAKTIATQVPGAQLGAICDADLARAKDVAAATGAATATTDPLSVINDPKIDAVVIASPDATHAPLTIASIRAGKPVLCEKPLAPTSADCLTVIEAEQQAGRRLVTVGFMRRFDPAYVAMKSALSGGAYGRPMMFHCFHRNVSAPAWFTSEMVITNSAPHEFDIARFMLDTDYVAITAFAPRAADSAKKATPVVMVLETGAGQLVNIEVNVDAAYGYDVRGELVCQNGTISLRSPVVAESNLSLAQTTAYPADWRPRFADAYRLELQAWVGAIRSGKPVGASAWDGYAATHVAEAGVKALASGVREQVNLAKAPKLYV